MLLYYLINTRKTKRNWLKKTLSHLAGLAYFSYEQIIFYKSFLRKVKSHLGDPARQIWPADLHIDSAIIFLVLLPSPCFQFFDNEAIAL